MTRSGETTLDTHELQVLGMVLRGLLMIGVAAALSMGCNHRASAETPVVKIQEGPGAAVCVARQLSLWGTIRSTANARVEGWGSPDAPSFILYDARGFNPVLTEGKRVRVIWLDGERVVKVVPPTEGEGGMILPPVEITGAMVMPEGQDLRGLGEGDAVVLLRKKSFGG